MRREIVSIVIPAEPMWEVAAKESWGEPHYKKVQLLMYCRNFDSEENLQKHFPSRKLAPCTEVFYSTNMIVTVLWKPADYHWNDARDRCMCGEKTCRLVGLHQGGKFSPDDHSWKEANKRTIILNADSEKKRLISAKAKTKREAKKNDSPSS